MIKTATHVAFFLLLATAAQAQERPHAWLYEIPTPERWGRAVEAGTRTASGHPGEAYWTNRARYEIEAELEPETAVVTGRARIVYENRSPKSLRSLRIHLRQNLHRPGAARLSPVEATEGVKLTAVKVNGAELKKGRAIGAYRVAGTVLIIRPPEAVEAGASTTIEIDWSYTVPARAPRNGHEDHHVYYLAYWYPQMAVFEDAAGWVADPYLGRGEFYMGYGDYQVALTVPHGWIVRATGTLENPDEVLTETVRKRLARAREGRDIVRVVKEDELGPGHATTESESGKLTWRFTAHDVRDFAISTSDRYLWDATHAVVKDRDGPGRDGRAMIHAVYEADAGAWDRAAEYARHTIEFCSARVLPYPWPHMTACEGIVGGGMEYPMMTAIGVTGRRRTVQSVIAHELVHMWFPMIVGSNEKRYAWMDEGMTTFLSGLITESFWKRGADPRRAAYRSFLRYAGREQETPCMRHADTYPGRSWAYGIASYQKPAAVFHQLRALIGDEVFFDALRAYAADWAMKHPYPFDLFNTFARVSGRDLDWYFRTFMFETWTVDHAVGPVKASDDKTEVTIESKGQAPFPTDVEVVYEDGRTERRRIEVDHWLGGATTKTLEFGPKVKAVKIDPDRISLDVKRSNNRWSAEAESNGGDG